MAEKKVIELEVKTNIKPLKTQLREAQQEVQVLSEKFGETSREAINAAKKAAELKDAIGEAKDLTDAFNPDAKFTALSNSIGGVTGGFEAFQGALGLVGVESEAVQKQLLKVQSAMALSQGLQSVFESVDSFKKLSAVIKSTSVFQGVLTAAQSLYAVVVGTTTGALKAMRLAMAATGIGALIIGVGLLISKVSEWANWTDEARKKQDKLNESLETQQTKLKKNREELQKDLEFKVKLAEAEGKTGEDLLKIKKSTTTKTNAEIYKEIAVAREKLKNLREVDLGIMASSKEEYEELVKTNRKKRQEKVDEIKELTSLIKSGNQDIIIEGKTLETEKTKTAKEAAAKRKEDEDAASKTAKEKKKEEIKQQKEAAKANIEAGKQAVIEQLQAIEAAESEYYKNKKTAREQDLDDASNKYFQLIEAAKTNGLDTTTLLEAQRAAEKEINDKYDKEANDKAIAEFNKSKERADKEMADAKVLADAKFQVARDTFSAIGNLASAFAGSSEREQKKAFEIQKAANIAGATMDTYKAATGAYSSLATIPVVGPGLGIAAAGLAIASGLANVKNISNQKFNGGGNVTAPTSAGGNNNQVVTPNFNIIGNQNQTQLSQLNQAPIKAYVVGSDVTTQQMLDKKKIQNATI